MAILDRPNSLRDLRLVDSNRDPPRLPGRVSNVIQGIVDRLATWHCVPWALHVFGHNCLTPAQGLEGNVSVQALHRAVVTHNVRRLSRTDRQQAQERGIVEEMVLLQIVPTEKGKRSSLKKMPPDVPGRPDVTDLVDVKSKWLDFTQQARAMSQRLYNRALGGGTENA